MEEKCEEVMHVESGRALSGLEISFLLFGTIAVSSMGGFLGSSFFARFLGEADVCW